MSWKSVAAAALVAAGLFAASPARAGDVFKLALGGDAETVLVGWHGHHHHHHYSYHPHSYGYGYYRPYSYGYGYYRPAYYYPRYSLNIGFGYGYGQPYPYYSQPYPYYTQPLPYYYGTPPVYYYTTPSYYSPISLGVETYSLPGGAATYSVTRPGAGGAEPLPPPVPRDGTFRYDGGPADPVPMPKADPDPMSAPRFRLAPGGGIPISLPKETKEAKGKYAYPAYGEEPRRTGSAEDRPIVVKDDKKNGR